MPKLLRSSETAGCGATIELDNGEVVYVSIAQTGVSVRRWDMNGGLIKSLLSNFFGPKLYNEGSVYKNAQTARALSLIYPEQATPLCFKNPVLAAFANAIWHCSSAAEVCAVFNEATAKTPELGRADAGPPEGDFKASDEKIVSDLAELMATGDVQPDAFYDVSVLPHPKEDILLAIEREILRERSDTRVELLAVGAAFLPSFQQGIGSKPLFWVGADLVELQRSTPNAREQIKILAQSPDRARAEQFLAFMKIENDRIQSRIDAALRLRKARMASPTQGVASHSPPSAMSSLATSPGPSQTRAAGAGRQFAFDQAGKVVIGMDDLLPVIARYTNEARQILDISEEEAIRRTEHGDGGRFALNSLVQILKDTRTYPEASYYAKFHTDEDGGIDSIHHGWCFDSFAIINEQEVEFLQGLRFADTIDGILSAFFASAILPTIGASWHGLYERDYQPVESPEELKKIVLSGTLKEAAGDTRAILRTPLGLRIQKKNGGKLCTCLCHSETEGLLDVEVRVSADGRAYEGVRTVLSEPAGRTFY
jgi:hypothetical protein